MKKQNLVLAALLIGLSSWGIADNKTATRSPEDAAGSSTKSAPQRMMEQADQALDAEAPTGTAGEKPSEGMPVVKAGNQTKKTATNKALPPPLSAPASTPPVDAGSGAGPGPAPAPGPGNILPGTSKSQTTLAPPMPEMPDMAGLDAGGAAQVEAHPMLRQSTRMTPLPSAGLPGLGNPSAGQMSPAKPIAIQAMNGVNEMVPVSTMYPNRIATPFASPKVVDFSSTQYQIIGSDVYVVPKGDKPIGIFIRDAARPDSSFTVALTLVPKQIPGVSVLVNIDGDTRSKSASKAAPEEETKVASYEDMLRKLVRRLVLNRPLSGYSNTDLNTGVAKIGALNVIPEKQFSGTTFDIYRYRIVNTGKESLELSEESFYRPGVKAVVFYPAVRLDSWKHTKVFIITGKDQEHDDE